MTLRREGLLAMVLLCFCPSPAILAAVEEAKVTESAESLKQKRLNWATEIRGWLDDYGFSNGHAVGETYLGVLAESGLRFFAKKRLFFDLGVLVQQSLGFPTDLSAFPVARITFQHDENTRLDFGSLNRAERFSMPRALYDQRLNYTRTVEYGGQITSRLRWVDLGAFLNWQNLASQGVREVFDYGFQANLKLLPYLHFENNLHGVHRGGPFGGALPTANNFATASGPRFSLGSEEDFHGSTAVFGLFSLDQFESMGNGRGALGVLTVGYRRWIQITGRVFFGSNFYAREGFTLYQSLGDRGNNVSRVNYQNLEFLSEIPIVGDYSIDVGFNIHRFGSQVDISASTQLRASTDMVLF